MRVCACKYRHRHKIALSSPLFSLNPFSFFFFWGKYLRLEIVGLWVDKGNVSFVDGDGEVDLTGVDKAWSVPYKYTSYGLHTTCTYLVLLVYLV